MTGPLLESLLGLLCLWLIAQPWQSPALDTLNGSLQAAVQEEAPESADATALKLVANNRRAGELPRTVTR